MKNFIASVILLLVSALTMSQGVSTSRVVDAETGETLPLVGVYASDRSNTLTNFDGSPSSREKRSFVFANTYIHLRQHVYTYQQRRIYISAKTYIHICQDVYTFLKKHFFH